MSEKTKSRKRVAAANANKKDKKGRKKNAELEETVSSLDKFFE